MRPLNISVKVETLEQLKVLAEATGQTVSAMVREYLEDLTEGIQCESPNQQFKS